MKFDYTKGEKAKYMVGVYRETVNDHYYVHSMAEAKKLFSNLAMKERKGVRISIYDMVKDVRKAFIQL